MKFFFVFLLLSWTNGQNDYTWNFDGCDTADYYKDLPNSVADWTRDDLQFLLEDTHRNQLVYTRIGEPGIDDLWAALIDVDVGSVPDTVRLLYTSNQVDAIPFGQRSWIKEHIFPYEQAEVSFDSRGPDISDIHNIRPASVLSSSVRGDKYFGECGVLEPNPQDCQIPAEGGADDTCSCSKTYTPPASVKGDIARALLYMDLRYANLTLTDCPLLSVPYNDMAYLSQLLTWHTEDPPDDTEIARNNQVCQHWQGNRNPFVDFPELAVQLHYEPFAVSMLDTPSS
jgi:endonuclease I